jgi:YVTN family beta-propeller protein
MDLSFGVSMTALRSARVGLVFLLALVCISCGDTFRPVAIPVTPNPPDPASLHYALIVSQNVDIVPDVNNPGNTVPVFNPGATTRIDVSGDTNIQVARVGLGPVHATILPNGSKVYVANIVEDTVSEYSPSDATTVNTITLPPGSHPDFVYTTQNDVVYAANSGNATVSAINTTSNVLTTTIPVGTTPVAITETPDAKKLYVANFGSANVTSINTVDSSVNATIAAGAGPIWAVARSDSRKVYVLNRDGGTLSVIDTFTDTSTPVSVGAGADFLFYSQPLNRLYVSNSTTRQLMIFDASPDVPTPLQTIDLGAGTNPPCPLGCTIASLTVLPDGSRTYVATYEVNSTCANTAHTSPCVSTQVTVIRNSDNLLLKTLSADTDVSGEVSGVTMCGTTRFRRFIASAADSSRVYVSNCDAGNTAVIRTSDDTHVLDLTAPFSSGTTTGGSIPARQNPVFVVAGR